MRHDLSGARALLCILTLLLPAAAAGSDPSADSGIGLGFKDPSAADEGALTGRLVEDDAYLRHGAVTTIATCLAVADDPAATVLWHKGLPRRPEGDPALAAWLESDGSDAADDPGFGTLFACARIVAAWHGALPDRGSADDGRIAHGAVVIDLKTASGEASRIDPEPLVRLLTSRSLLPPNAHGGVVVRNAWVDGTLLFYNLHLNHPLVFVRTRFGGGTYPKGFIDRSDIEDAAVSIQHSRFSDHVAIINSRLCGDLLVRDSSFQETLLLSEIRRAESGCQAPSRLAIQGTRFVQALNINRARLDELHATSNEMDLFLLSRNEFARRFLVESNTIGTLTLYGDRFSRAGEIKFNRIAHDLYLDGSPAPSDGSIQRTETLEVVSNGIGGGLVFQDFSSSGTPDRLNLRSNHVGNGSQICLPWNWRGEVKLDGSSYEGTLAIGLRYPQGVRPPTREVELDPPCHGPFFIDRERAENPFAGNTYCEPVNERTGRNVLVDLTATEIRTLQWHLPFNCTYRWSGFGLTYDLWMPPERARADFASNREKWHEAAFNAWRTTLKSYEPASLDMMSRYFADKGEHVASRELQLEAKRLNYAPECAPSDDLWSCMGQVVGDPASPNLQFARSAYAATGLGGEGWDEPLLDRIWRAFKLVLLWPGGYGAKPERAILLLLGGTVVFALIYGLYCGWVWRRYVGIDALFSEVRARLAAEAADEKAIADPHAERRRRVARIIADIGDVKRQQSHTEIMELVRARLLPELEPLAARNTALDRSRRRLEKLVRDAGSTHVYGFSLFNAGQMPTRFTPLRYSIDAMIPVIDLHAYSSYYPEWWFMRGVTVFQHVLGWWWLTVFVASAAIL